MKRWMIPMLLALGLLMVMVLGLTGMASADGGFCISSGITVVGCSPIGVFVSIKDILVDLLGTILFL